MVSVEKDYTHSLQKMRIENLEDEGRKLDPGYGGNVAQNGTRPGEELADMIIDHLLRPTEWQPDPRPDRFFLDAGQAAQLCEFASQSLQNEAMLLRLRAPIKVYGDVHGQYLDLMRLFARYKAPTEGENGDIDSTDYLFLGDYVDRGSFSLETICLLFALRIKHPGQIHLLRGNHEDPTINHGYGFRDECQRRLHEDCEAPNSCWNLFNRAFEWLPLGALIEDRILCLHGGIGGALNTPAEIARMQRPIHVAQVPETPFEQRITDILWSDPSDNDGIMGVTMNDTRDQDGVGKIVKFGPDRVESFLKANPPLSMIIRAHECVMDGFERFADGKLITVFSATDYCGHHKNAGALLFVRRDLTIVPKLIYPVEREDAWDHAAMQQRPPTPPRPGRRREEASYGDDW